MSLAREVLKYAKHPGRILPRLTDKVLGILSFFLAKAWVGLRGRDALRKGRRIFLYGAFGGRRFDDNSAAFFEFMVANHPEIDSYWVIRKDCFDGKIQGRSLPGRKGSLSRRRSGETSWPSLPTCMSTRTAVTTSRITGKETTPGSSASCWTTGSPP